MLESGNSTASMDPQQLWQVAQEELRFQVVRPGYEAWLANAVLVDSDGHTFTVGVPTMFARDWVSERYVPLIRETLSGVLGRDCEVIITVDPEASPPPEAPAHVPDPTYAHVSEPEDGANDSRLNPAFTFSTFVVGNSSRFAHAACRAVAEAPGKAYNPLFLYGGVGLGKTHLMHAIGHYIQARQKRLVLVYMSADRFINEMINAIRFDRLPSFRQKYRAIDVLLVDDIQFIAGKDRTQEEFFHIFNALHDGQKQIVISSDCPPRQIPTLEERLHSRFEWGLIADIQPPDIETKVAILRKKAEAERVEVPENVALFIASKVKTNIRELEGSLIRLIAYSSLTGRDIDLSLTQEVLKDLLHTEEKPITIEMIQKFVADHYNVKLTDLKAKNNSKSVAEPRQIAMYLTKALTDASLPEIGKGFGGKHHSTVIHSVRKIDTMRKRDPEFDRLINSFVQSFK
jgi:chromosomal replication initiator protein